MLSRVSFTNRTVIFTNQVISFTIYNPTHNNTNNAYSITSIPRVTRVISTVRDPSAASYPFGTNQGTCGLSVTTFFHQVLNYYYLTVYIMFKPKMSLEGSVH